MSDLIDKNIKTFTEYRRFILLYFIVIISNEFFLFFLDYLGENSLYYLLVSFITIFILASFFIIFMIFIKNAYEKVYCNKEKSEIIIMKEMKELYIGETFIIVTINIIFDGLQHIRERDLPSFIKAFLETLHVSLFSSIIIVFSLFIFRAVKKNNEFNYNNVFKKDLNKILFYRASFCFLFFIYPFIFTYLHLNNYEFGNLGSHYLFITKTMIFSFSFFGLFLSIKEYNKAYDHAIKIRENM